MLYVLFLYFYATIHSPLSFIVVTVVKFAMAVVMTATFAGNIATPSGRSIQLFRATALTPQHSVSHSLSKTRAHIVSGFSLFYIH